MNSKELINLLNSLKIDVSECTVLSSGALTIRGILDKANDLDIAVTKKGLDELRTNYDLKEKEGNHNWYIVNDQVECVFDESVPKEKFGIYNLQDINDYYKYLKGSKREKDIKRIPLVENYINRTNYVNKYSVLETPRLLLRKARKEDLEDMYNNIWTDQSLTENMLWCVSQNIEAAEERLDRNIFFQQHNFSYYVILKETNHVVGWAGVVEIAPHLFEDHGICIAKKYQNQELGKEILNVLKELVFEKLGGDRFIYTCFKNNKKSSGLCTSQGFTYLSSELGVREHDGMQYILKKYALDYDKYLALKNNKLK